MPFFKEALLVKENDRQQLNLVKDTGNEALINTIVAGIFNDDVTLINGARARLEAMRMQVLLLVKLHLRAMELTKILIMVLKQTIRNKYLRAGQNLVLHLLQIWKMLSKQRVNLVLIQNVQS